MFVQIDVTSIAVQFPHRLSTHPYNSILMNLARFVIRYLYVNQIDIDGPSVHHLLQNSDVTMICKYLESSRIYFIKLFPFWVDESGTAVNFAEKCIFFYRTVYFAV